VYVKASIRLQIGKKKGTSKKKRKKRGTYVHRKKWEKSRKKGKINDSLIREKQQRPKKLAIRGQRTSC